MRWDSESEAPVISAVVLAAGLSARMGRPKLLLPYGEHTVVEQVVSVLLASPADEVLVVTGHERAAVERALAGWPVRAVFNPGYAAGEMLSSVQVGLAAAAPQSRAALLAVGDMPAVEAGVVAQLVAAYRNLPESLVLPAPAAQTQASEAKDQLSGRSPDDYVYIPSYRMRAGHPVLVPRSYWPAILALPRGASLRSVWQAEGSRIHWVTVDTPSVLRDMDTPADYDRELRLRK
jgi:molybdenum cofactor cytidylyltransferase